MMRHCAAFLLLALAAVRPAGAQTVPVAKIDEFVRAEMARQKQALAESQSLGWLVSFVIRPDPTRLAPSPPFEADAAKWRELVDDLEKRLVRR